MDPLAHEYPSLSSYVFSGNNPLNIIDPDGMQLTKFENAETGETIEVYDGMDQTVTISQADWATAKSYASNEDGHNPGQGYNSFIKANGGVAVPTQADGGSIPDHDMALKYLKNMADWGKKEVAAWEMSDQSFIVQSFLKNEKDKSDNDPAVVLKYGKPTEDIVAQWHTHPGSSGPSEQDFDVTVSNNWHNRRGGEGVKMHTVSPNGDIWQVFQNSAGIKPPLPGNWPYGKKIGNIK